MGINTGGQVVHSASGLSMEEICQIGKARRRQNMEKNGSGSMRRPSIFIDASWLGYHLGTAKSNSVASVFGVGLAFVKAGGEEPRAEDFGWLPPGGGICGDALAVRYSDDEAEDVWERGWRARGWGVADCL